VCTVAAVTDAYAFEQLQAPTPADRQAPADLLARAAREAEAMREQARQQGHQEGYAEGLQQGVEHARSAAAAIAAAAAGIDEVREQESHALERDAAELALALAEKILAGTLDVQRERVLDVVHGALRHVADRRTITIVVNPDDMEIVMACVGELRAKAGGIENCEVQADRRVAPGGAIVGTSEGEVDACVLTQLQRAREVIAAELGTASVAPPDWPVGKRSRAQSAAPPK
jgi:flagellar biosynthesis/type III secretory pathway protein FliH